MSTTTPFLTSRLSVMMFLNFLFGERGSLHWDSVWARMTYQDLEEMPMERLRSELFSHHCSLV